MIRIHELQVLRAPLGPLLHGAKGVNDAEYRRELHDCTPRIPGTSCLKLLRHSSNKSADLAAARLG